MLLSQLRVGVVGASIAGLSVANVLTRAGAHVSVFERGSESFGERGGGLGVSLDLCRAIAGAGAQPPPHIVHARRRLWVKGEEWEEPASICVTAYGVLWRWLRQRLDAGAVQHLCSVTRVEDTGAGVRVTTGDARVERFDLVVAADGGASELRRLVEGDGYDRQFAGYVLWRGLVRARDLGDTAFGLRGRFHIANRGSHHFVAYPIPSHSGSTAEEDRLLNWGWYYPLREEALAALTDRASLHAPHVLVRNDAALRSFAAVEEADGQRWPDWVLHVFARSRALGAIAPHPVFELVPGRLAAGNVVLVGDAAHLASPITGSGARMAMEDAIALGAALEGTGSIQDALTRFADARRGPTAEIVHESHRRGAAFRADRGDRE